MTLQLAPDLALPDDFATQGVAIIGVRGSGKSNTEVRYAELLHGAGIPFVAIDPKGDWYGIRMEGTGPGLPVPVFGGLYGDFPLEDATGARVADLLVDENLSAVLDVSRLSKTVGLPRFLIEFCNRLMDRHQQEPHVRTVILEEAHRYIPQATTGKTAALKEAAAALLLEGRSFGLGCWACTQRPARLHNDVLEEVDTAVIHRIGVTATADLKRVRDWVKHEDLGPEVSESLTKLRNGEAWVLSPSALDIVQRVQVDRRTTFDSGATPTVGAKRRAMATMATIDAGAIKEALADTIERAEAVDPKRLQARVRELERELSRVRAETPEPIVETVEVPVLPDGLGELIRTFAITLVDLEEPVGRLSELSDQMDDLVLNRAAAAAAFDEERARRPATPPPRPRPVRPAAPTDGGSLGGAPAAILAALVQHPDGLTRRQVAAQARLSPKKSTIRNALSTLRTRGYIDENGEHLRATDTGIAAAGPVDALPTGPDLQVYWQNKLGLDSAPRRAFDALVEAAPRELSRDELTETTGDAGSTMRNALSKLRGYGLIDGNTRAAPELMEALR